MYFSPLLSSSGLPVCIYLTNTPEACCFIADSYKANIIVVENDDHLQKILQVRHTHHTTITSYNHTWGILYVHVLCSHLLCVCVCVCVCGWVCGYSVLLLKAFLVKKNIRDCDDNKWPKTVL